MTTIAFDGRSIAADRMCCIGNTPVRSPQPKIRRLTFRGVPAVMGTSGAVEYGHAVMDWLEAGAQAGKEPQLSEGDESCSVLVATKDNVFLFANSCNGVALGKIQWASGSGADYALGAMAMGASARRAVEIAVSLDVNSGCGVDVLRLGVK